MAALATQTIVPGGVGPTYAAAAGGGDTFTPDNDTFVHIKNGSGGALTATFAISGTYHGLTVTNLAVSVPAGGERMIGPFPADAFSGGITYSGVTSLTVGVFKLPSI
jgi:hypothetical protein